MAPKKSARGRLLSVVLGEASLQSDAQRASEAASTSDASPATERSRQPSLSSSVSLPSILSAFRPSASTTSSPPRALNEKSRLVMSLSNEARMGLQETITASLALWKRTLGRVERTRSERAAHSTSSANLRRKQSEMHSYYSFPSDPLSGRSSPSAGVERSASPAWSDDGELSLLQPDSPLAAAGGWEGGGGPQTAQNRIIDEDAMKHYAFFHRLQQALYIGPRRWMHLASAGPGSEEAAAGSQELGSATLNGSPRGAAGMDQSTGRDPWTAALEEDCLDRAMRIVERHTDVSSGQPPNFRTSIADVMKEQNLSQGDAEVHIARQNAARGVAHIDSLSNHVLDLDAMVLVRAWGTKREARRYHRAMSALIDAALHATLPTCFGGPVAVLLLVNQTAVTVTWLPPLANDTPLELRNRLNAVHFSSFATACWRAAMSMDEANPAEISLLEGVDGVYYGFSIGTAPTKENGKASPRDSFSEEASSPRGRQTAIMSGRRRISGMSTGRAVQSVKDIFDTASAFLRTNFQGPVMYLVLISSIRGAILSRNVDGVKRAVRAALRYAVTLLMEQSPLAIMIASACGELRPDSAVNLLRSTTRKVLHVACTQERKVEREMDDVALAGYCRVLCGHGAQMWAQSSTGLLQEGGDWDSGSEGSHTPHTAAVNATPGSLSVASNSSTNGSFRIGAVLSDLAYVWGTSLVSLAVLKQEIGRPIGESIEEYAYLCFGVVLPECVGTLGSYVRNGRGQEEPVGGKSVERLSSGTANGVLPNMEALMFHDVLAAGGHSTTDSLRLGKHGSLPTLRSNLASSSSSSSLQRLSAVERQLVTSDQSSFRSLASITQGVLLPLLNLADVGWTSCETAADGSPTMLLSRQSSGAISSSNHSAQLQMDSSVAAAVATKVTLHISKRTIVSPVALACWVLPFFDLLWAPNRLSLLLKLLRTLRREESSTPCSRLLAKAVAVLIAAQCATIPLHKTLVEQTISDTVDVVLRQPLLQMDDIGRALEPLDSDTAQNYFQVVTEELTASVSVQKSLRNAMRYICRVLKQPRPKPQPLFQPQPPSAAAAAARRASLTSDNLPGSSRRKQSFSPAPLAPALQSDSEPLIGAKLTETETPTTLGGSLLGTPRRRASRSRPSVVLLHPSVNGDPNANKGLGSSNGDGAPVLATRGIALLASAADDESDTDSIGAGISPGIRLQDAFQNGVSGPSFESTEPSQAQSSDLTGQGRVEVVHGPSDALHQVPSFPGVEAVVPVAVSRLSLSSMPQVIKPIAPEASQDAQAKQESLVLCEQLLASEFRIRKAVLQEEKNSFNVIQNQLATVLLDTFLCALCP